MVEIKLEDSDGICSLVTSQGSESMSRTSVRNYGDHPSSVT